MENVRESLMDEIWKVALNHVYQMYLKNSSEKREIG